MHTGFAQKMLRRFYQALPIVRDLRKLDAFLVYARHQAEVESARLAMELKQSPRYCDSKRLLSSEFRVSSQNGEDGIIREIFKRIGTTDRRFVEVGVDDGIECNTAFLLTQGWRGSWIDGGPQMIETVDRWNEENGSGLTALAAFVTRENVASLFERLNVPVEFDFLSLDIDQNTFYAWEGLRRYRPRVVAVEYNAILPPDMDWKVRYNPDRTFDGSNNYGASLKAFENLGKELGYRLVGCDSNGVNAFFIRSDIPGDRFSEPFTAENHYEPPRFGLCLYKQGHRSRRTLLDADCSG